MNSEIFNRAFAHPVKAVQHLSKLARLAAIMPKTIQLFTLEHINLQTVQYTGRKIESVKKFT